MAKKISKDKWVGLKPPRLQLQCDLEQSGYNPS